MYFMHLKYERPALFWSLIPYLVFALVMMDYFWPDALRLMRQRMQGP
jgi:F0F1-type ATP synthase membrane subunit b/b'